ncbi:nuclear transport factor 2 family protein [Sphingomicrobium sediminis]|uniref:Nuclear transport factor 2 family protein n=1 Tax=Sphingomicrobium sediminis TaxID=2950949 RepID=A0A9X2EN06_9SPHN|nr:nuclear transport factor 2 family protein [Sphingomicrobium sediminis]MCM8558374.1 nuclear transport factor 2 family protein [Sphingomicrobium sediminis]
MKLMIGAAMMAASLYAYPAHAQEWSDDQADVWGAVSAYWEAHVDGNTWHEAMTDGSYGWGGQSLLPRSREQMASFSRVFGAEGEVLHYQLDPLAITVHGDTALVHYMANIIETNHKGEREANVERCSDTMVREDGEWKFLGWGCADMGGDD